ncbi:MAG TPA: BBE domain-containing protein [Nocardioidaceae bacterium]|nr:BBE domain-containing protein [Nocardioidaceae bacterium]
MSCRSSCSASERLSAQRYERLVALKRRFDHDNFFRRNQNIPPG